MTAAGQGQQDGPRSATTSGELPLQVLLVEDELAAREELKYLLSGLDGVQVVGEAADGATALREAVRLRPDAVFLDIQMPGTDGLALAQSLRRSFPELQIVFATAHDEHAISAFDLDAVDYLLKPFEPERVARAVQRLQEARALRHAAASQQAASGEKLPVERLRRTFLLSPTEISWIGMQDGLVTVVSAEGTRYTSDQTLRDLEQRLDGSLFFRCHREAIVNLSRVRQIKPYQSGTYRLVLDDADGSVVPLARNRVRRLREILPW